MLTTPRDLSKYIFSFCTPALVILSLLWVLPFQLGNHSCSYLRPDSLHSGITTWNKIIVCSLAHWSKMTMKTDNKIFTKNIVSHPSPPPQRCNRCNDLDDLVVEFQSNLQKKGSGYRMKWEGDQLVLSLTLFHPLSLYNCFINYFDMSFILQNNVR